MALKNASQNQNKHIYKCNKQSERQGQNSVLMLILLGVSKILNSLDMVDKFDHMEYQ